MKYPEKREAAKGDGEGCLACEGRGEKRSFRFLRGFGKCFSEGRVLDESDNRRRNSVMGKLSLLMKRGMVRGPGTALKPRTKRFELILEREPSMREFGHVLEGRVWVWKNCKRVLLDEGEVK